jgi:hypothetical protein
VLWFQHVKKGKKKLAVNLFFFTQISINSGVRSYSVVFVGDKSAIFTSIQSNAVAGASRACPTHGRRPAGGPPSSPQHALHFAVV